MAPREHNGPTRMDPAQITIVLADDHAVLRNGLRLLLDAEEDMSVLGEAGDVQGAFRHVRAHRPNALVLDLNMPGGSSIQAIPRLLRLAPSMAIVMLTMEDDPALVRGALGAGASSYVQKASAGTELVRSIRAAVNGHS
ncbi:MAG: response regulator [Thermoleophilaceae bacterium]